MNRMNQTKDHYSQIRLLMAAAGYELWLVYDEPADVYALFTEPEEICWIGEFDTVRQAERFGREWIAERRAREAGR